MDKIFKIINCCSREETHNNSELNVKIDNSQENNQSLINSKLEEKDKSLEIKNEPLIIKPTESNIINDIINEKKERKDNINNEINNNYSDDYESCQSEFEDNMPKPLPDYENVKKLVNDFYIKKHLEKVIVYFMH